MPTLNWIGKEAVVKHHKEVPFRLLEPVPELSCSPLPQAGEGLGERESGNLIVQGDNLHALKALLPRYAWKLRPLRPDVEQVRAYVLTESWLSLLNIALSNASHSTS